MSDPFRPFETRMQAEGLPDIAIRTFRHYYRQLIAGESGLIPESRLRPVPELPNAETLGLDLEARGREVLNRTIVIKLNGGLGTGMGLEQAKSLLSIKNDLTFLDVIAGQSARSGVPLVLMNSFATQADSLAALAAHDALPGSPVGPDFLQHKVPKIDRKTLGPASWPPAPHLSWCPPGHGDLFTALVSSGVLERLRAAGRRYAFVSNADNLGAVLDPIILGYFAANAFPFLMEVADRTEADKKGGHLAIRPDGQLTLRELAQCPLEDHAAFQAIDRYRYFNTNNLWIDLDALSDVLAAQDGILRLPLIRNLKTVDPRDPTSPEVYQLETAMGSAIAVFSGAEALRVPRARFAPVKTTADLLAVRSDAYELTDDGRIVPAPLARQVPVVSLDSKHYKLVDGLDSRFPGGPPSMFDCHRLEIVGDIRFDPGVTLQGTIRLENKTDQQIQLPAGVYADVSRIWG